MVIWHSMGGQEQKDTQRQKPTENMTHNCPPLAGVQGVERELVSNAEKYGRCYSEDG